MSMNRRRILFGVVSLAAIGIAGASEYERGRTPDWTTPPTDEPANRLYPADAAGLFRPGTRHRVDTGDVGVAELLPAGLLRLPTGRLVAVDPTWLPAGPGDHIGPFTATVQPGAYPLTLALLRFSQDLRVAAARLAIRDEPIAAWDMAVRAGEDPSTLRPGQFFDVGVDAATIALFDAMALDAMSRLEGADFTTFEAWHADRPVEREVVPGANAISFSTGWGDGGYPVWIGRTHSGAVGCFIVDMLMLAAPASPSVTPWAPETTR